MNLSTLGMLAAAVLLFSCGDEASLDSSNEDLYRKKNERKLSLNENFGNNGNNQSQATTQQAPFDLGISAVLGAGALAAIRTARKRRKAEAGA